jgi:hypothetical protein
VTPFRRITGSLRPGHDGSVMRRIA